MMMNTLQFIHALLSLIPVFGLLCLVAWVFESMGAVVNRHVYIARWSTLKCVLIRLASTHPINESRQLQSLNNLQTFTESLSREVEYE